MNPERELTDQEVDKLLSELVVTEPTYDELRDSYYRLETRFVLFRVKLKELAEKG